MQKLSISTTWQYKTDYDIPRWLSEVRSLGFQNIELGYELRRAQVENFLKEIGKSDMKVSSLHNYSPIPDDGPTEAGRHVSNYYRLSSSNEAERKKAVKWTNNSIDVAIAAKAEVVVIHAGTIELEDDPSKLVFDLFKAGKAGTQEFQQAKEILIRTREDRQKPFRNAVEQSLVEVMAYAQRNNIKIGLETRYYPTEIPNFDEVGYFLNKFSNQGMFYWHDVGHAEVNARLGLIKHEDFLTKFKNQMIGVHLHGIKDARDHLAPFDGDMDLKKFLPMLPSHIWRVFEVRYATADQIKSAVEKLTII